MKNSSGQPILDNKPALVIAYKNRALDLFIRMCTSFCPLERIVRIGHLSKDNEEELKCTLLNEKVKSGLDRNRTVELQAAMEHQYERQVQTSCSLQCRHFNDSKYKFTCCTKQTTLTVFMKLCFLVYYTG